MKLLALLSLIASLSAHAVVRHSQNGQCSLPNSVIEEIRSYEGTVKRIFDTALRGDFKGKTYSELDKFLQACDYRMSGSEELERGIDYILRYWKSLNVSAYTERALIPHYRRGYEDAVMTKPFRKSMEILGLGRSVGTPPEGITAQVLVVRTFKELRYLAGKGRTQGKMIIFNQRYSNGSSVVSSYRETVLYRTHGAVEASKAGAVAALTLSITPRSIGPPHTGGLVYDPNVKKIPAACLTTEDADLIYKLQRKGKRPEVTLILQTNNLPMTESRNTFAEIKGRTKPKSVVAYSAHIDSWDITDGALDDGGGVMVTVQAAALFQYLNLRPKRTLRAALWTGEELGLIGSKAYIKNHRTELRNYQAILETDIGTFKPLGMDYFGHDKGACLVQEILKLLAPYTADKFRRLKPYEFVADSETFAQNGVPSLTLNNQNSKYYWYHHTEEDTIRLLRSKDLDECLAVFAAVAYVLADVSQDLSVS